MVECCSLEKAPAFAMLRRGRRSFFTEGNEGSKDRMIKRKNLSLSLLSSVNSDSRFPARGAVGKKLAEGAAKF
jgi:hypothetical protein